MHKRKLVWDNQRNLATHTPGLIPILKIARSDVRVAAYKGLLLHDAQEQIETGASVKSSLVLCARLTSKPVPKQNSSVKTEFSFLRHPQPSFESVQSCSMTLTGSSLEAGCRAMWVVEVH
jgi:hypothetical protein